MNINKLYSSKSLCIKGGIAFAIPILSQVLSAVVTSDEPLLTIIIITFVSALIYSVPFILSLYYIKADKVKSVKRYVGLDLISLLIPSVLSALLTEVADLIINGNNNIAAGAFVILFGILYSLISSAFWLIYIVNASLNKTK